MTKLLVLKHDILYKKASHFLNSSLQKQSNEDLVSDTKKEKQQKNKREKYKKS